MPAKLTSNATSATNRSAWLDDRRRGIGGSDASIVMGCNPYRNVLDLYNDKVHGIEQRDSSVFRRGRILEPIIKEEYKERTGIDIEDAPGIWMNDEAPWAIANIDGMLSSESTIVEIKTAGIRNYHKFKNEGLPPYIQIQGQHYMMVFEFAKALFIVFSPEYWDFFAVEIERDDELIDTMAIEESMFWTKHVLTGIPPILAPAAAEVESQSAGESVVIDDSYWSKAEEDYLDAVEISRFAATAKDDAKKRLSGYMAKNGITSAVGERLRATRYVAERTSIDKKLLTAYYPQVDLSKVQKTTVSTVVKLTEKRSSDDK